MGYNIESKDSRINNFWMDIINHKEEHTICDGVCYYDGGAVYDEHYIGFLGFDGKWFNIKYFDGREIFTNNLWCNGRIPDEYLPFLEDNAVITNCQRGDINA